MNKLLFNRVNIIALTTILFVFIVSLILSFTNALYVGTKTGEGSLVFSNGIFFELIDMDTGSEDGVETNPGYALSGQIYHINGSDKSSATIEDIEPNAETTFVSPKIKVVSDRNTESFCVRVRLVYTFYDEEEIVTAEGLGLTTNELIANVLQSTLSFNSNFVYHESTGYYYLLNSGTTVSGDALKVLSNATTETITLLGADQQTVKFNEWDKVNGGPYGIDKMQIVMEIDVIQEDYISEWGFSKTV